MLESYITDSNIPSLGVSMIEYIHNTLNLVPRIKPMLNITEIIVYDIGRSLKP